ncbi:MAG: hypothetical protein AAF541_08480 [Pseudomonadota bacterium]
MQSALSAYLDSALLPQHVRKQLRQANQVASSTEIDFYLDQLAIRLTLRWQDENPLLLGCNGSGTVLVGMLLRRLAFVMQYVDLIDFDAPSDATGLPRPVVLLAGCFDGQQRMNELAATLATAGVDEFACVAMVSHGKELIDAAVPESVFVKESGVLLGCGFDVDGYGANLPDLYHIP